MTEESLLSRRDLDFLLFDWLGIESLLDRPRFAGHDRELYESFLDLASKVAAERFAPHNKASDEQEPVIENGKVRLHPDIKPALDVFAQTGLVGSSMDADVGGLQMPYALSTACIAWFQAANIATMAYPFLTTANANLLLAHATSAQIDTFVQPMLSGLFHGTMCLSEPQAGSSLSDIATRATPEGDGVYRIRGNKMWISAGDHELGDNIVHLVLARDAHGPPGIKGLSLFIVPKYLIGEDGQRGERNDVVVAGVNHKMGYRGTVNTLLNFGEGAFTPEGKPGAVGYLVGEAHQGLRYMFHMMNEARIGVGAGAAALGYTGYLKSLAYARTRVQGRLASSKDPSTPQVPIIEHPDVRRMLLAQKSYVEGALALVLYCGLLVDETRTAATETARDRAHLLLEVLTPVAKSWPSQWGLAANDLAIQVLGGYGYSREYGVEQHYRDNRLNPIHEGTHGVQGMDLLGRKVTMSGGDGLELLRRTMTSTVERAQAEEGEAADLAAVLAASVERLVTVTRTLGAIGDPDARLADASVYLEAAGHVVIAWIWLEQYLAAGGQESAFHQGKRQAARYFFRYELPRTGPQFDLLVAAEGTTLAMEPSWF